ncbi:CaiB/BaiF CoA transferase family protein [Agromyces aerolatus]|uniref:CaiB/BaiF CoA transferase family protein n=1 Tax=Agromyces sp. LY-1074 TaxID=3074080 RepID=UPI00285E176A|nr:MULTISPECIES: CaiB/BaiF CoA-transferase family protein [unclassified Agromyces]MDR5699750.1 CaiB/BaiF CoA-transferase family protein [Agromyces sp. LY-1074]MDR5706046.1 CaiB/BaiF CoA-transferase family protein [Agromyces sp. LY-1358]
MSADRAWRPLDGLVVLDLSRMLPGGTATLLLADLGATVHKVEHPSGDDTRRLRPAIGDDSSAQHQYLDRGKRSHRIDLKTAEGREQVVELARSADAVIESFRPGVADRLGIGYRDLSAVNERLVYVSLSGYGQDGPRAQFAGHDLNFAALASLAGPTPPRAMHADVAGGMLAALAIAAGSAEARATGRGRQVDVALMDAALFTVGMPLSEEFGALALDEPVGTPLDGNSPCYRAYRCADGRYVAVAAIEPKFWRNVVALLEHPEWESRQDDPALVPELERVFLERSRDEWSRLLDAAETCVTPVRSSAELLDDPHLVHRGSLQQRATAAGPLWQVAPPFAVSGAPTPQPTTREKSHA